MGKEDDEKDSLINLLARHTPILSESWKTVKCKKSTCPGDAGAGIFWDDAAPSLAVVQVTAEAASTDNNVKSGSFERLHIRLADNGQALRIKLGLIRRRNLVILEEGHRLELVAYFGHYAASVSQERFGLVMGFAPRNLGHIVPSNSCFGYTAYPPDFTNMTTMSRSGSEFQVY
ncbi:MAG: hypothetical protein AAB790_01585 [Patescibacteria group bacterium]